MHPIPTHGTMILMRTKKLCNLVNLTSKQNFYNVKRSLDAGRDEEKFRAIARRDRFIRHGGGRGQEASMGLAPNVASVRKSESQHMSAKPYASQITTTISSISLSAVLIE